MDSGSSSKAMRCTILALATLAMSGICQQAMAQEFIWPTGTCKNITSPFGPRGATTHKGTDISCGGTIYVYAIADGKVTATTNSSGQCTYSPSAGTCPSCDNHNGNSVTIDHGNGYSSGYLHLKSRSMNKGDVVKCGDLVGIMGTTGCSTGQHLHLWLKSGSEWVDPEKYISKSSLVCPLFDYEYQSMMYDPQNTDINGDGLADICARGAAGIYCAFSTKDDISSHSIVLELSNANGWNDVSNYATIKFADVNGDNKADLCARSDNGIECWLASGNGFDGSIGGIDMRDSDGYNDVKYYSTIRFGDINGDGKDDFCARFKDGFKCHLSTGSGFGDPIALNDMSDSSGWHKPEYYSTIRLADVNGDGMVDVCGRGSAGFRCWISEGNAFQPDFLAVQWNDTTQWNKSEYYLGIRMPDINGDHKADICARDSEGIVCHLSNGTSYGGAIRGPSYSDASGWNGLDNYSTVNYADLNGDGKDDLCIRANARLICHLSTGEGFGESFSIDDFSDSNGWNKEDQFRTIRMADVNGDKKADVCGRFADGIKCFLFNGSGFTLMAGPTQSNEHGWSHPEYYSTLRIGGPTPKPCALLPEICDGKDNNCDGQVDENNVCCKPETEICDEKDNDCDGEIDEDNVCCTPETEVCDEKDNDCDGDIDEDNVCCSEEVCDEKDNDCDGDIDEDNVCCSEEICDEKDNDCDGDIDEDGVCDDPETCVPEDEICDEKDNDCDGDIDEDGVCDDPEACIPQREICDGKDNDCDGDIDENEVCCEDGNCCVPQKEVCDGIDNDCDGKIDENGVCSPATPQISIVTEDNCSSQPSRPAPTSATPWFLALAGMLGLACTRKSRRVFGKKAK